MQDLIRIENKDDKAMSSRDIADLTNKEHKNIIRDIENMLNQLNLDKLKFEHIYKDTMNRGQREYFLNKDLTLTLISGYSIPLRHKIIQRWQEIESQRRELTQTEILVIASQKLLEIERANIQIQNDIKRIENLAIEANSYNSSNTGFMTIRGFCNIHKIKLSLKEAQEKGRLASKLSEQYEMITKKTKDEVFGEVKSYSIELLNEVFNINE